MHVYSVRFERKVPIWVNAEVEANSLGEAKKYLMEEFPDYPDDITLSDQTCSSSENNFDVFEVYDRHTGVYVDPTEFKEGL